MSSSLTEENSRSSLGGLSDSGSETNGVRSTPVKSLFRPSKLTAVADQMWKKDQATVLETKKDISINLLDKKSESMNPSTIVVSAASSSNFIFGQNIKDRVTHNVGDENVERDENSVSSSTSNTKSDFKDIVAASCASTCDSSTQAPKDNDKSTTSLEESAKAYEAKNQQKMQLVDQVEVKTGEEGEVNIVQVVCKLHIFDAVNRSWNERGAAILRVNDVDPNEADGVDKCSTRVVVRLHGSLRVVVNTKVFADMLIERVSPKRLKLSAIDGESKLIVLFLISASQSDIDKVHDLLSERSNKLRSVCGQSEKRGVDVECESTSPGKKQKTSS